jgi:hypothetical protein
MADGYIYTCTPYRKNTVESTGIPVVFPVEYQWNTIGKNVCYFQWIPVFFPENHWNPLEITDIFTTGITTGITTGFHWIPLKTPLEISIFTTGKSTGFHWKIHWKNHWYSCGKPPFYCYIICYKLLSNELFYFIKQD